MRGFCQSRDYTSVLAVFGLETLVDIGSTFCEFPVLGVPGVARPQVTFLASPRKVTKRRRPEVRRPSGALRYSKRQAAAELGLEGLEAQMVAFALALKQSSRTTPVISALLGDSHRDPTSVRRPLRNSVVPAQAGTQFDVA